MSDDPDQWAFPDQDHRFSLGIHPGEPGAFFGSSPDRDRLLIERRHWLTADPSRYVAVMPEIEESLAEVESLVRSWGMIPGNANGQPFDRVLELGRELEPDLVFLVPGASGELIVVGGCVCFPSFWRLSDKLGLPMEAVHEPVPELNPRLGPSVRRYLTQMKSGSCWLRSNWGLARRPDLNEHPDRGRHPWKRPLSLEQIWIRRKDQAILSLPASGGILFGIRVVVRSVAELIQSPETGHRFARGLRTMPAALIRYKGIEDIHQDLMTLLEDC